MRSTIACESKAKVKCKHTGSPPCQGCLRSGTVDSCILGGPTTKHGGTLSTHGAKRKRDTDRSRPDSITTEENFRDVFASLPRHFVTRSMSIFRSQFPEYGFIHPSDLDFQPDGLSDFGMLKLLAIVAVSHRYMGTDAKSIGVKCASIVSDEVQSRLQSLPCLEFVQTVLIMVLHQWGEGEGYSAWLFTGIAVRMAQGSLIPSSLGRNAEQREAVTSEPLSASENRTVWTCFLMDRLLSCGRHRPALLKFGDMEIELPANDEAYALCTSISLPKPETRLGFSYSFRIIIQGLDIWSVVHGWAANGGRKHVGMTEPQHCPWQPMSHWAQMRLRLEEWRNRQEWSLKYPETKVTTHAHFRRAEVFAYINLIYYVSLVFLCREYIPFLPLGETGPRGPLDPPLLKDTAPNGFWEKNSAELFHSVAHMTRLMRDLRYSDASISTPFTGLCAFTSALMNLYLAAFPYMGGGCDASAAMALVSENIVDLKMVCGLWKLGDEWLETVEAARNLYRQVSSMEGPYSGRGSRDHYPELEDSINLARLKGMPTREPSKTSPMQTEASIDSDPPRQDSDCELSQQQPSRDSLFIPGEVSDINPNFDAGTMSDEGIRLWSFWDDPFVLSRLNHSHFE